MDNTLSGGGVGEYLLKYRRDEVTHTRTHTSLSLLQLVTSFLSSLFIYGIQVEEEQSDESEYDWWSTDQQL